MAASVLVALLWASPILAETFWVDFEEAATVDVVEADGTVVQEPITDLAGTALYRKLTGEKSWTFVRLIEASSPIGGATRSDSFELPLHRQDTWTIWVKLCSVRMNGEMTPDSQCSVLRKLRRGIP